MMARLSAPVSSLNVTPAPHLPGHNRSIADLPDAENAVGTDLLLRQIMAVARIAVWDARCDSLELIRFNAAPGQTSPFGLSPAQIEPGASWLDSIYPADHAKLRAYLHRINGTQPRSSVDYRLIVGEGELLWVRHWTLGRFSRKNERPWIRSAIMPIPEQKHLEWECLRVSERECNRIGQELHDDLCQVLAGLTFMMRVVGQRARHLDATLAADVDELNTHVVGATERVRSMAHGLFPAQLNYTSVREALLACAAEARTLFRIQVNVNVPSKLPRHNPEQIIQVYRIVQEALSNAVRHGEATIVTIDVIRHRLGLQIAVEDNGRGFPLGAARPEGIGLHVMEYRARALGGTLELKNLSPRGVAARLIYPTAPATSAPTPKTIATP
jgi:signal transduction histidine kinase